MAAPTIRAAEPADADAIEAIASDTWPDREMEDYLPHVFEEWARSDDEDQYTVVATVDGDVVGVCQALLLSEFEAWLQGMRVAPAHRGEGHGLAMVGHLFEWASDRGATVARNLVFSWNTAGLGQSLAAGFEPRTSFRWLRPEPADVTPKAPVDVDPAAAWSFWTRCDARTTLGGLALDRSHGWALAELTRERLHELADEETVLAVKGSGTRGLACRVGVRERDDRRVADYGVAAWTDDAAAEALVAAIRADAAVQGADATRVLIPETPRHVAEAAYVRAAPAEEPHFVTEADLTGAE